MRKFSVYSYPCECGAEAEGDEHGATCPKCNQRLTLDPKSLAARSEGLNIPPYVSDFATAVVKQS